MLISGDDGLARRITTCYHATYVHARHNTKQSACLSIPQSPDSAIPQSCQLSLSNVTHDSDGTPGAAYNRTMQTTKETLQVESRPGAAPEVRVMKLAGSLTLSCCYEFQDRLRADTSKCLILDMSEVKFVDSSGIGCLVNGYIAHHMAGGRFLLAGVNKRIRETLEETRVQQFFQFFETVEEAEKAMVI